VSQVTRRPSPKTRACTKNYLAFSASNKIYFILLLFQLSSEANAALWHFLREAKSGLRNCFRLLVCFLRLSHRIQRIF
ncbi:MAG: hypothetical protein ACK55Z_24150, partial [bacterium]